MGRRASWPPCCGLGELVGALHLLLAGALQSGIDQVGRPLGFGSSLVDVVYLLGFVFSSEFL